MAAEHNDLIGLVGPRDLGDRVVAVRIGVLKLHGEVNGHRYVLTGVNHACDAVKVFGSGADLDRARSLLFHSNAGPEERPELPESQLQLAAGAG